MTKETIRVGYADFWPEWPEEDFITPILDKHFNVVVDQANPDVLFHSIFGGMRETPNYGCKKVLFLGENKKPENYGSNYSVSFDPHNDTNYRLPLWQVYILNQPNILERLENRVRHDSFERWCSFTVSNPSNFMRNSVYQQLNSYKRVHSYGRYLTNDQSLQQASQGRYWRDAKEEFFDRNPHKFSIAYENTPRKYYCTEKLMDAFLAGSMPIYWGDPAVAEDWNEKAFVNGTRMPNVVEHVKQMDTNEQMFLDAYNEPVFTDEQIDKLKNNLGEFEHWLIETVNA